MGLTQAELANLVELSLPTIARIESGESDPKSKDLAKLSIALGTSVSYLMGETDESMGMRLGERIKKARKGKGTQAELAEQIGVHEMTIRRWESGERYPDADMLQKLAAALGTSVSYLVGETEDPQAPAPMGGPSSPHLVEGKNVVSPVAGSDAPVVFQIGEMRLELPPTPETYAFLERQLRGILPTGERLPAPSQEDAGERSA